jgi:hypothetical protein
VIEEETTGRLDFEALRDAIERCEADVLIGFYSEDAELRVLNAASPDGPAFELHGKAEIERYLCAVCDQEMSCTVEGEIVFGEECIIFEEMCAYPDGTLISVETTLEVHEGRISRQRDVVERSSGRIDREVSPGGL